MSKELKILWTDMHSNIHHENMKELEKWYMHSKECLDFWPIAYYPFYQRKLPSGMGVEDVHDFEAVKKDWEILREFVKNVNKKENWPMFMGYEWQGTGDDGDHNVFFKDNDQPISFPLSYKELYENYKNSDAIAIPHHIAYQSHNRGKNWDTHVEKFSPFVEMYSSHGSSENDYGNITMLRHVHMGPRTEANSAESGLKKGHKFGFIASGDNHSVPAVAEFGLMGVLSEENTKEAIWEAMNKRHVYGVSNERMKLNFNVDEAIMGDEVKFTNESNVSIIVEGSNALDRIEVIEDNEVVDLIHCRQAKEDSNLVQFKFKLEFGWGPDRRIFPDIESKLWHGKLTTKGEILSVEKCWNSFGQKIIELNEKEFEFNVTSYKTTQTGKWMGSAAITTEGFIVEVVADINDSLDLVVDGVLYTLAVKDILEGSQLFSLDNEINKLIMDTYQETSFYRNDTWWHNAYKFKVNKGACKHEYCFEYSSKKDLSQVKNIRVKAIQKNGCIAWSSPIFSEE